MKRSVHAWILVNLVQLENLVGSRCQSFSVSLVVLEERTIGTSFLLAALLNSSVEELLSTLFFGYNSSLSVRNDGPCHHNVFSVSCVALEPLLHRSAGLSAQCFLDV